MTNTSAIVTRTDGGNGALVSGTIQSAAKTITITAIAAGTIAAGQKVSGVTGYIYDCAIGTLASGTANTVGAVYNLTTGSTLPDITTAQAFGLAKVPTGYALVSSGGSGLIASMALAAHPAGFGNELTIRLYGTAAAGSFTLRQTFNAATMAGQVGAGKILRASAELSADFTALQTSPVLGHFLTFAAVGSDAKYTQTCMTQAATAAGNLCNAAIDNSYLRLPFLTGPIIADSNKLGAVTLNSGTLYYNITFGAGPIDATFRVSRLSAFNPSFAEALS